MGSMTHCKALFAMRLAVTQFMTNFYRIGSFIIDGTKTRKTSKFKQIRSEIKLFSKRLAVEPPQLSTHCSPKMIRVWAKLSVPNKKQKERINLHWLRQTNRREN